jgi:hypothetical protein
VRAFSVTASCSYLLWLGFRQSQDIDGGGGKVPILLRSVVVDALVARTVVAACASLAIFIFIVYSLCASSHR